MLSQLFVINKIEVEGNKSERKEKEVSLICSIFCFEQKFN